jgi:hypothetical protein
MIKNCIVASLAFCAIATMSLAQGTGSQGYFEIYNDTRGNIVVGIYTNDGSGWSSNWLADQLAPGEHATAEFTSLTGYCDQTISVGWLGNNGGEVMDDPISIDICAASNVYLNDNEIYYD